METPAALVLAAGASSRMGRTKQILEHRGRPLVRHVAEAARVGGCSPVRVVVGADAEAVRRVLAGVDVSCLENAGWQEGLASSIRCGIAALPERTEAVLLLLCDQPAVTAELVAQVIHVWRESGRSLAACAYDCSLGPPALFGREHFPALLALRGDAGARKLLLGSPEDVAVVAFPEGALDVDTPEDWERWLVRESG